MIDYDLLGNLIDYNIYRKTCFKNGIIPIFEDKDLEKILSARYMKVSRVKKRLVYLLARYSYIYFVTFTFDDDYISKCDRTKKDLIKSSLNSFSSDIKYILNIDYGKKNDREHYHCIVATNDNKNFFLHIKSSYPCFTWIDRVYLKDYSINKLSKYINKLSNHATKDTTRSKRIIYNFKGYDNFDPFLAKQLYIIDYQKLAST